MPVAVAAAGRGAGCGAQPGLRGSRPRSVSASRSRGRAGGACRSGAESSAGSAASRSRGAHGPSPRLPGALWGRFPTCRALRLLWDLEAAFVKVMWGLSTCRSLRPGIAGLSGGVRARLGELAQISGLFGSDMWWS